LTGQFSINRAHIRKILICFFFLLILLGGCKEKMDTKSIDIAYETKGLTDSAIQSIRSKTIFFGHMSVGYNIIEGLEDIQKADSRFNDINIVELDGTETAGGSRLYHAKLGNNGFPKKKCDEFKKILIEGGLGSKIEYACLKFCYVDFMEDADVKDIFDYYVRTIDDIKKEFPDLKIIHFTTPLTVHVFGMKSYIKNLLKGDIPNIKRNEFNKLLIAQYGEIDPVFDLAEIESTLPDGTRKEFTYKGSRYYSLVDSYTDDGGHLNGPGRFYAAKGLLVFLSDI